MSVVALSLTECQSEISRGWTDAKRARYRTAADANFKVFEAEFATSGVSRRALRAVYCAHSDRRLVEVLLTFGWYCGWPSRRVRQVTKALGLKRCASSATKCWLHQRDRTLTSTTGYVAVLDA
jgi:hypothetical protein